MSETVEYAVVQTILLDVSKSEEQARLVLQQNENNRRLWRISVMDDGERVDLSQFGSALLQFRMDGHPVHTVYADINERLNTVDYLVKAADTAAVGALTVTLQLYDTDVVDIEEFRQLVNNGGFYEESEDTDTNVVVAASMLAGPYFSADVRGQVVNDEDVGPEYTEVQQYHYEYAAMVAAKNAAASSASDAAESEIAARGYAGDAESYKNEASGFAADAEAAKVAAKTAQEAAETAQEAAEDSEDAVRRLASDVEVYARSASGSASDASQSASAAAGSATTAEAAQSGAEDAKDDAFLYKRAAEEFATTARNHASAASASASNASQSAADAAASAAAAAAHFPITAADIADDAVIASKIKNKNVTTNKIADNAVTEEKLAAAVQTKLNRGASAIPATYDGQPTNVQDYLDGIVQNVTGQFGAVEQRFGQVEADKQALWNAVNTGAGYLQQLAEALGGKLERRIVDALPASGQANVLYLLKGSADTALEELPSDEFSAIWHADETAPYYAVNWRYDKNKEYYTENTSVSGTLSEYHIVIDTDHKIDSKSKISLRDVPDSDQPILVSGSISAYGTTVFSVFQKAVAYTLYLYIDGAWLNLSDYYTKAEIDEKLAGRLNEGITVCRHAAVTGRNAAGSNIVAVDWTKFYVPVDPAALVGRDPYLRVTLTIDDTQGEPFLGYTEIRLRANSVEYKYKIQPEIGIQAPGDYPMDIPLAAFVNGNQSVLEQTSPITSFSAFGYGKENAPAGRYSLTLSDLRITRDPGGDA